MTLAIALRRQRHRNAIDTCNTHIATSDAMTTLANHSGKTHLNRQLGDALAQDDIAIGAAANGARVRAEIGIVMAPRWHLVN